MLSARAASVVSGGFTTLSCIGAGLMKSAASAAVCIGNGVASGAATGAGVGAATSAFFGGNSQQQAAAAGRGATLGAMWGAANGSFSYLFGYSLITLGAQYLRNTGIALLGAVEAGSEIVFPYFTTVDPCLMMVQSPSCSAQIMA